MPSWQALLATDLDGTLVGDRLAFRRWQDWWHGARGHVGLAYVTGRSLPSALTLMLVERLPRPDLIIANVGASLAWAQGGSWQPSAAWQEAVSAGWQRGRVLHVARQFPQLTPQPAHHQHPLKVSFHLTPAEAPETLAALQAALRRRCLQVKLIYSSGRNLDLLPTGAGKGAAVAFAARQLGLAPTAVLTCGDSGNDREMLELGGPSVLVGNCQPEMVTWPPSETYRALAPFAGGILEGLQHHGWLDVPAVAGRS